MQPISDEIHWNVKKSEKQNNFSTYNTKEYIDAKNIHNISSVVELNF